MKNNQKVKKNRMLRYIYSFNILNNFELLFDFFKHIKYESHIFSMISNCFERSAPKALKTVHAHTRNIAGSEWFCTDNEGRGIVCSTGNGSAPSPINYLLMALGACSGAGIKFNLEKRGKKVKSLDIDVTGNWTRNPSLHISDIQLNVSVDADVDQQLFSQIVDEVENKFCPVAGTLINKVKITSSAVVK